MRSHPCRRFGCPFTTGGGTAEAALLLQRTAKGACIMEHRPVLCDRVGVQQGLVVDGSYSGCALFGGRHALSPMPAVRMPFHHRRWHSRGRPLAPADSRCSRAKTDIDGTQKEMVAVLQEKGYRQLMTSSSKRQQLLGGTDIWWHRSWYVFCGAFCTGHCLGTPVVDGSYSGCALLGGRHALSPMPSVRMPFHHRRGTAEAAILLQRTAGAAERRPI